MSHNCGDADKKSRRRSSHSSTPSSPRSCKSERLLDDSPFIDPGEASDEEYFKYSAPPKKSRAQLTDEQHHTSVAVTQASQVSPSRSSSGDKPTKPLRSFLIDDILSYKPKQDAAGKPSAATGSSKPGAIITNSSLSALQIVRPWDTEPLAGRAQPWPRGQQHGQLLESKHRDFARPRSADDESFDGSEASESSESPAPSNGKMGHGNALSSPLDALFQMTSKTLEGLNNNDKIGGEWHWL